MMMADFAACCLDLLSKTGGLARRGLFTGEGESPSYSDAVLLK